MPKKLTAKDYIKKAVKIYLEDHGASNMGSYRDVITDTLHLAFEDKELRKEWVNPDEGIKSNENWDASLKEQLLLPAYDNFEEEREQIESDFLYSIKAEDLPTYVNHPWEFMQKEFEKRLKGTE